LFYLLGVQPCGNETNVLVCGENAQCENFECVCLDGFLGDGINCESNTLI